MTREEAEKFREFSEEGPLTGPLWWVNGGLWLSILGIAMTSKCPTIIIDLVPTICRPSSHLPCRMYMYGL